MDNAKINRLIRKLKEIDDPELTELVHELIEERHNLNNEIKIDSLTGTYNRRIIETITNCSIMVMCDIDNFKNINDTYGHSTGDEVIKKVAQIISSNIRGNDYVCRYGGGEFLIAFTKCNGDIAKERMKKIQKDILMLITLPDFEVTISVGISKHNEQEDINALIKEADDALYESKTYGKDKITVYEKEKSSKKLIKTKTKK